MKRIRQIPFTAMTVFLAVQVSAGEITHEAVGLQVSVPDGWAQESDEDLLVVEDPSGEAAVLFLVAPSGSAEEVTGVLEEFVATVIDEATAIDPMEPTNVNGVEGLAISGTGVFLEEDGQKVPVTWVAGAFLRGAQALIVVAVGDEATFAAHEAELSQILESIRPMAAAEESPTAPQEAPAAPATPGVAGPAQFRLVYTPTGNPDHQRFERLIRESGLLETCVQELNASLTLNTDVTIRVADGDGPIFYPDTSEIVMNYDFMAYIDELYRQAEEIEASEEELQGAVLSVVEWVLYHEVGHALIAQFDLPVVGREEDAVDSLAAVVSLEFIEGGADIAASAAGLWLLSADSREVEEEDFWDAHSLDLQRFTSIVCWMVGSNPEGERELVADFEFDDERTENCAVDYQQQVNAWMTLLGPHMRP